MSQGRTISQCSRCGETGHGLERPPLAGEIGQRVFVQVCSGCWSDWFNQSITVINHYGLNPALREDRQQLYDVMAEYLNLSATA